jgi:hypothetical protein
LNAADASMGPAKTATELQKLRDENAARAAASPAERDRFRDPAKTLEGYGSVSNAVVGGAGAFGKLINTASPVTGALDKTGNVLGGGTRMVKGTIDLYDGYNKAGQIQDIREEQAGRADQFSRNIDFATIKSEQLAGRVDDYACSNNAACAAARRRQLGLPPIQNP